jgi:CRISPR-associated endonuclease/helicase Cas3
VARVQLLPQSEKLAPANPWRLEHPPLYHQWRTHQALQTHDLVVNAYNTGTGKTNASLLHLFDLDGEGKNVLFIAPTNALLHQHVEDIREFVEKHPLDFRVLEVNASLLRQMMEEQRPGETLQRLIQNPLTYGESLGIPPGDHRKLPIVLVVNPDIFYYALYFRYGSHDQRNVFQKILTAFDYIVIDEFHYYDSKQLANFLFFFVISQEFDYFQNGRRICLLSATPNPYVEEYLDQVFGDRWALLTPRNEPVESVDLPTKPVLTSLEVELVEGEIQDWAVAHRRDIAAWLDAGQDGALISSALWRVNTCYTTLRGAVGEARLGRITGPEPEEKRARATGVPLILATPTVDIGYNFKKQNKTRQNIDFLVCDARYGDELLQRLGRAGRVLGKPEQDGKSRAVALLPTDAYRALAQHDGETLSRAEFAYIVEEAEALPPKQSLYAYVRTHAITECFYPIYQVGRMMPEHLQERVEALYERVREVFAPTGRRSSRSLRAYFGKYWGRKRWLRENKEKMSLDQSTAEQVADWIKWREDVAYTPADLVPHLAHLLKGEHEKRRLRDFVAGQLHLTESLFNFRDSFQGPTGIVYDADHLLSSETVNAYDLMHLVSYYRVQWLDERREFLRNFGETDLAGDLYGVIREWREPRLVIELYCESPWPRKEFDERVCRRPVALQGLRLTARERGGDRYPLDPRIAEVLGDKYVTVMGIKPEDGGIVYGKFKGTSLFSRRLTVSFPDGQQIADYRTFLGTQAFQAHAELLGYFYMQDRLESEAIII